MKSWRTTASGWCGFMAALAVELPKALDDSPVTVPEWGLVVTAFVVAVGLSFARDQKAHDAAQAAEAKPEAAK